ncbi:50S ribosomal protein L25/general stress protein Ctc [Propionibacteriaceae bacterium G1746]|uniref:50S ribosomal protein L25/general stress protein Ctc n=1 Tax=Aestuariimicrobium sp. G57 TaxID=3418485 RepID=UPI003C1498AE
MAEITLAAQSRTEFGKGAARRLRRDGQVPAVLYGHGTDPVHIALPGHETLLALRTANALLSIEIDGKAGQLALPKQVQRDPIKGFIEHVDLLIVKRGEKVSVDVPLIVVGDAESGSMVGVDLQSITVLAPATSIPGEIEVSVEGLTPGTQILLGAIALPEGVEAEGDPETLVINITNAPTQAQLDAELAGAEAEAGIEHEAPAAEAEADEA